MSGADDDDVKIVHLREGAVRIILPGPDAGDLSPPPSLSPSTVQSTSVVLETQTTRSPPVSDASHQDRLSHSSIQTPQDRTTDRHGYQSVKEDAAKSWTGRSLGSFPEIPDHKLNLVISDQNGKENDVCTSTSSSQHDKDELRKRTEEKDLKRTQNGRLARKRLHSDELPVSERDAAQVQPTTNFSITESDNHAEMRGRHDQRKYSTFPETMRKKKQAIVTTLPTGVTRIVLRRTPLQRHCEDHDQLIVESENTTDENTKQSIDPKSSHNKTENEGLLFSHLTFDCLQDVEVSSENEEQLTHLLLTAESPETEDEDLHHSDHHADWQRRSSYARISSNINSNDFVLEFVTHRGFSANNLKHGQSLSDVREQFSGNSDILFTKPIPNNEWNIPDAGQTRTSDRKTMWMEGRISSAGSDDTAKKSGGVNGEDNSDSECVFSGHTFSRAMWRSTSAEASHLNPSFSFRTPLQEAFTQLEWEISGSTSSDEEQKQRFSFFSGLPWVGKSPRLRTKDKGKQSLHASPQSAHVKTHKRQMQTNQESDTDHKSAERYLEATLSLVESQRTKTQLQSKPSYISGKVGLKDVNWETLRHSQEKKPTEDRQTSFILKTHQAVSTLASSQSSSELSSTDSNKSATFTPEEKGELESISSSSVDSVHTVYFVPEIHAHVDTSSVTQAAKRSQILQSIIQKSQIDLHSSSGPEFSDVDEKAKKRKRPRLTGVQQESTLTHDFVKNKNHLWHKHQKDKPKQITGQDSERLSHVDEEDKPKPGGPGHSSVDSPNMSEKGKQDEAGAAPSGTDAKLPSESQFLKLPQTLRTESHRAGRRRSSLSSGPESLSISGSHPDSDCGRKTPQSCSSSNDLLTSESEIGPLVTFPRKTVWGGTVLSSALAADSAADSDQESLTAVELRRRFSSDEYVPASPFASHLKRFPSNLSEGSRPLFLQKQRSHSHGSHARQVSMDIGEEWENVQSTTLSLPPTSPVSPLSEDEDVFFGPSASSDLKKSSVQEYIPLEELASDKDSKYSFVKKRPHQTSAKLRLLYPNPADPRCVAMSQEEQRSLMFTLTQAELLRLQLANSPLLELLKDPKKDGAHKVKKMRMKQERSTEYLPFASAAATSLEHAEVKPVPVAIDPKSQKPIVTVQPMPQVLQEPSLGPQVPSIRGGDVVIPITPIDVLMDNLNSLPPFKRQLLPNPFNRLNQRFHSTLQCPCFFFFCFLCYAPALVFMKWSDYEFDYGSVERARRYGRRTTVLYVIGSVLATCFLVSSIVATVVFLQESLLRRRGWS